MAKFNAERSIADYSAEELSAMFKNDKEQAMNKMSALSEDDFMKTVDKISGFPQLLAMFTASIISYLKKAMDGNTEMYDKMFARYEKELEEINAKLANPDLSKGDYAYLNDQKRFIIKKFQETCTECSKFQSSTKTKNCITFCAVCAAAVLAFGCVLNAKK